MLQLKPLLELWLDHAQERVAVMAVHLEEEVGHDLAEKRVGHSSGSLRPQGLPPLPSPPESQPQLPAPGDLPAGQPGGQGPGSQEARKAGGPGGLQNKFNTR